MIKYIEILILIAAVFLNCEKGSDRKTNLREGKPSATLGQMEWIIGTWQRQTSRGTMYESWKMVNDTLWRGKAYRLADGDTMILEKLSLEIIDDEIFYVPIVPHNEGAVYFKLTELTDGNAVFENPEHDFPQRIMYMKMSIDSLHARIEGINNGVESAVDFYFKRIK